jgi:hypothetical protein
LLAERTAPELLYLECKWASLMSYGLTAQLLSEVLPLDGQVNPTTVRRHLQRVGQRTDSELGDEHHQFIDGCPAEWERLPRPEAPLTVGLDGGYVHARDAPSRGEGWFEVIAGKSMTKEGSSKCFAFVHSYDTKPKRRLFEVLRSQGMQMNQQVTFLSDGGDTVRDLQFYLNPQAEHVLDWFHVTMRLTVMGQMAKSLRAEESPVITADTVEQLERLKWYLWHGNVFRALQIVDDLQMDVEAIEGSGEQRKLLKALREFQQYIMANKPFIPNYGDRFRNGETISSAFVESTVNQVVSKRFVKKQQMRWTKRGAHLLLPARKLDGAGHQPGSAPAVQRIFRGTFRGGQHSAWRPHLDANNRGAGLQQGLLRRTDRRRRRAARASPVAARNVSAHRPDRNGGLVGRGHGPRQRREIRPHRRVLWQPAGS